MQANFSGVANGALAGPMLDIDWPRFERSFDSIMTSMDIFYDSDKGRSGQALYHLNDIFKFSLARDTPPLAAGNVFKEHCGSDGHMLGPANTSSVRAMWIRLLNFPPFTRSRLRMTGQEIISLFLFPVLGVVVIG